MLAEAKVNLFLRVGGRLDSGLHQLSSLICPISLADTVEVELRSDASVAVVCELEPSLQRHMQACLAPDEYRQLIASLNSESNLAGQAVRKFNEALATQYGAVVRIEKRVPIFAGLGGGSGNAAAVLMRCNELFDNQLSQAQLLALGAELGSDVPQAMVAGVKVISGSGEIVSPVAVGEGALSCLMQRYQLLIIKPNIGISTKLAYESLGRSSLVDPNFVPACQGLLQDWLSAGATLSQKLFANDFLPYVETTQPLVKLIKNIAKQEGCEFVFMSGSGSAFVGVFSVDMDAEHVASEVKSKLPKEYFVQSCKLICKS